METTTEDYIRERHDRRMDLVKCIISADNDITLFWDVLFPEDYETRL